jgi:hypothetical protein
VIMQGDRARGDVRHIEADYLAIVVVASSFWPSSAQPGFI